MTTPPDTRPQVPYTGTERELLDSFLDFHRATLLWKCAGLTDDQLRERPVPPSGLALLGLVRHLTEVERGWFHDFLGEEAKPIYYTEEARDDDFDALDSAEPAVVFARYEAEMDRIRRDIAAIPLETEHTDDRGRTCSLRWVYIHMIEEYARHNGHADLIRERIDGATGE
jgi:uncharacterized damage-inducible protein DinB